MESTDVFEPGIRVLAVNASAQTSGAEAVLLDLLRYVESEGGSATVACPAGPLAARAEREFAHVEIPSPTAAAPTDEGGATRRGGRLARLFRVLRVIPALFRGASILRKQARSADLVLVNSTMALPLLAVAFPPLPLLSGLSSRPPRIAWLVHDTIAHRRQRVAASLGGRVVDVAVAVSEATRRPVAQYVPHSIVRTNGVEISERPSDRREAGEPVVGVLAVITSWKGQDVAIEAIAKTEGVHLEIAGTPFPGDTGFAAELEERVRRLGLEDRVRFLGHVDKRDVLGRWDALLSTSVMPEAGPLGVLEAMSAGVPVIATAHGGAAEYLRDGRGILVPLGDPEALAAEITSLVGDAERRKTLGERAHAAAVSEYDKSATIPLMWNGILCG